jgi:hypothetical protein
MSLIVFLSLADMTTSATLNLRFQERVVEGIKVVKDTGGMSGNVQNWAL